ncbi:MAG TPA: type VI secretion system ImpA family N-terminal domain-containing protein, partial [Sphingomicrobium sp.]
RQEIEGAFEKAASDNEDSDDIDWRGTISLIEGEAARTRDIWLAIYLMRAGAKIGRLDTVEDGARLLAGLCENLWESVHPELSDYGFQGRKGPCESLTRFAEFLRPLRNVVLLEHPRLGSYTGADFDRFRVSGDSEDGYGMFRALLAETPEDDLQAVVDRLAGITDSIRRADTVMTANAEGDTSTNFQPTYEAIDSLRQGIASFMTTPAIETADSDAGGAVTGGSAALPSGPGFSGGINSREDVIKALDAISLYYKNREPGSPVPFALRRARDWVSLNFLQVLEDIAPNSMDEAKRVLGNGRTEGSDSSYSSSSDDSW